MAINKLTGTFSNNNEEAVLHKVAHPFNASAPPILAPGSLFLNNPPASAWAAVIPQNLANVNNFNSMHVLGRQCTGEVIIVCYHRAVGNSHANQVYGMKIIK
ncbi:hypothetical protein PtA15_14A322 [Puccinia triticina]|uniref:Uncharacterized protein n=1 Tax=Puccinia triticina TaxID=208348 RepID=A0ABY7D4B8_9BASI|nr:uncharacterized protein PtA15_14A322 [Puccinia triticina]WAQ91438.1 hypothetical protein PtA15_14A322 [Puccinia triticina]WAR62245.1 hypothetical protein PtB15_14B340 [Puccinia triticina]